MGGVITVGLTSCAERLSGRGPLLLLVALLVLSAYVHLWNPAEFPRWFRDEGTYIERAMTVLDHGAAYGTHDHPFLGWTVLAGFMHVAGYPDPFVTSADPSSLGMLYGVPRVLMGMLAVLDTFLVYKIAERRFGRRAAPIAAVLFAVMPVSLTLRMVLLDSILLPFVLSSVLLAMHARSPAGGGNGTGGRVHMPRPARIHLLVALSGACMGCAILTKIPSFAMMPLVAALIYYAGRRPKLVLLWLAPAILIPLAWPASAALAGEFDIWTDSVIWQSDRDYQSKLDQLRQYIPVTLVQGQDPDVLTRPMILLYTAISLFWMDPAMIALGIAGLAFAAVTRNRFLILWVAPVLLFFGSVGWVSYFHLGMLWTAMCVAAAALIGAAARRMCAGDPARHNRLMLAAVLAVAVFGMSTSGVIIHWDAMSAYLDALSFALQRYDGSDVAVATRLMPVSFIAHAYGSVHPGTDTPGTLDPLPTKTGKAVMVMAHDYIGWWRHVLEAGHGAGRSELPLTTDWKQRHVDLYDQSSVVAEFQTPPRPHVPMPKTAFLGHVENSVIGVMERPPPEWALLETYAPAGRALGLDGSTRVTFAGTAGHYFGGADPFSISFWIKASDADGKVRGSHYAGPIYTDSKFVEHFHYYFGNQDVGPVGTPVQVMSKSGEGWGQGIRVWLWGSDHSRITLMMVDDESNSISVSSFHDIADGHWHHIVFTYDGSGGLSGLNLYVDGRNDSFRWTGTQLTGSVANGHPIAIGHAGTQTGGAPDALLDDVRVYSAELPAYYISAVHECHREAAADLAGEAPAGVHACAGDGYGGALLAHLEFEGDLHDSSGNGRGGTAHGDVRYVQGAPAATCRLDARVGCNSLPPECVFCQRAPMPQKHNLDSN